MQYAPSIQIYDHASSSSSSSARLPDLHLLPAESSLRNAKTVVAGLLESFMTLGSDIRMDGIGDGGKIERCVRVVYLAYLAAISAVVAASVLQGVGALAVREYARRLRRVGEEWEGVFGEIDVRSVKKRGRGYLEVLETRVGLGGLEGWLEGCDKGKRRGRDG